MIDVLRIHAILGAGMLILMYGFGIPYDDIFFYVMVYNPLFWISP